MTKYSRLGSYMSLRCSCQRSMPAEASSFDRTDSPYFLAISGTGQYPQLKLQPWAVMRYRIVGWLSLRSRAVDTVWNSERSSSDESITSLRCRRTSMNAGTPSVIPATTFFHCSWEQETGSGWRAWKSATSPLRSLVRRYWDHMWHLILSLFSVK